MQRYIYVFARLLVHLGKSDLSTNNRPAFTNSHMDISSHIALQMHDCEKLNFQLFFLQSNFRKICYARLTA